MRKVIVVTALIAAGCNGERLGSSGEAIVAGAGYTTFDATRQGCKDSPNGVNCNNYESKDDVYMSGGPAQGGYNLSDGSYYFAVLVPGTQNGGFLDGADGNLSDTTAGATAGDAGSGDTIADRTFTIADHEITYAGPHALGTSSGGRTIVQLMPYDDTSNAGGVYILAICLVGATSPSQCKYDAFRVQVGEAPDGGAPHFPVVNGGKYYDANANGRWDDGEPGIAGWPIDYSDLVADEVLTDAGGLFSVTLIADTYAFVEKLATNTTTLHDGTVTTAWKQTGNTVDQTSVTGGATATLNGDKSYTLVLVDDSTASGILFGNVCLGAGGGLTLGFWSNKNGQALITTLDLAFLASLNLRTATGGDFDPASKTALRSWLLNATATNMAYMLSAQLAAMELDVRHGFVSASALLYAPGATCAGGAGFCTVGDLMTEANASLGAYGTTIAPDTIRAYQEALKNALDNGNNNLNFVQPTPASCPTPTF